MIYTHNYCELAGYNLDFLDQLDDPNFNPFATKTAVKAWFLYINW